MPNLRIPSFGGGVVISGAPDTRAVTDVLRADGVDIQPRGSLSLTGTIADFRDVYDQAADPAPWTKIFFIGSYDATYAYAVGEGEWYDGVSTESPAYFLGRFVRYADGLAVVVLEGGPFTANAAGITLGANIVPLGSGAIVTSALIPGTFPLRSAAPQVPPYPEYGILLVNVGAREGFAPRLAPGLYAVLTSETSATSLDLGVPYPIEKFCALGTGYLNDESIVGTPSEAEQLYPRGIIAYNNHVFAWGFDASNTDTGEGPARVMFSNLGLPHWWGNDNQGDVDTARAFTDSDAIVLGGAGEVVRAAIVWGGKLWFFTNQQGHYIAGYGRDSFITDGATPVLRSQNVVGPMALAEGPDRMLYGVGDDGLWRTADGNAYELVADRLRDYAGESSGYWDLIWRNPTASEYSYPGRTNQDLVWLAVDHDREQVIVGIPFCDATAGSGEGTDTVLLKWSTRTGGFTRQVFADTILTAPGYLRSEGQFAPTRFLGLQPVDGSDTRMTIQEFTSALPDTLPTLHLGSYAPFGPDGQGVVRQVGLVLAWDSEMTPPETTHRFGVTVVIDGVTVDAFDLYLQASEPGTPSAGDYWVDLSTDDASIGNDTASGSIPARPGFLLRVRTASGTWMTRPGMGGTSRRLTIPLPAVRTTGTRYEVRLATVTATSRFSVEGLSLDASSGTAVA